VAAAGSGDFTAKAYNAMTISWGSLGIYLEPDVRPGGGEADPLHLFIHGALGYI
jgi:hypothetical protein